MHVPHERAVYLFIWLIILFLTVFGYSQTDSTLANSYFANGENLNHKNAYDSAAVEFRTAGKLYETIANSTGNEKFWIKAIDSYLSAANSLQNISEYDTCKYLIEKSLAIGRNHIGENNLVVGKCYYHKALINKDLGNYRDADKELDISGTIYKSLPDVPVKTWGSWNNLKGVIKYYLTEFDLAIPFYEKALECYADPANPDSIRIANVYSNFGLVYYKKFEFDESIRFQQKALNIRRELFGENDISIGFSYNNLGIVYQSNGDFDKALHYHQMALDILIAHIGDNNIDAAGLLYNIALDEYELKKYEDALKNAQRSVNLRKAFLGNDHPDIAWSYVLIGTTLDQLGQPDAAIDTLNHAIRIFQKSIGKRNEFVAYAYSRLAKIYNNQNAYVSALETIQKGMDSHRKDDRVTHYLTNPSDDELPINGNLIQLLCAKTITLMALINNGNDANKPTDKLLELAFETANITIKKFNEFVYLNSDDQNSITELDQFFNLYPAGINAGLELYRKTGNQQYLIESYNFIKQSKYISLRKMLEESKARRFAGIPDSLLLVEKNLRRSLVKTRLEIDELTFEEKSEVNNTQLTELQNRLFALNLDHRNLINSFKNKYPKYYQLISPESDVPLTELQSQLSDDEAVIDYFYYDNTLFAAVITANDIQINKQTIDDTFDETIDKHFNALKHIDFEDYRNTGTALYNTLVYPLKNQLTGIRKLIIIPGGKLHYIPFESLLTNSAVDNGFSDLPYLLRDYQISYHYHSSLIKRNKTVSGFTQPVDFVGFAPVFTDGEDIQASSIIKSSIFEYLKGLLDYRSVTVDGKSFVGLPYSAIEIRKIHQLFVDQKLKTTIFLNNESTEAQFVSIARQANIIHIATHGLINANNPSLSGLLFYDVTDTTSIDDGIFRSDEAFNLNLNADLLVMSSCESGIGKLKKGEGMIALTRGFLYAGARNIIHSLWKVNDKHTSELMVELYNNILNGQDYGEALHNAKLKLIAGERTAFPASWSSFVLIGR